MPSGSLIPDRQLTFSPDLAATIGLEESILLQGIGPLLPRASGRWHALVITALEKQFPFWNQQQIRDLLARLADLGIIALLPGNDQNSVRVAIAASTQHTTHPQQTAPEPTASRDAAPARQPVQGSTHASTAESWRPSEAVIDLLALNHGVDRQFALAQLAHFDRGPADHTREGRFRQHVLGAWRRHQREHPAFEIKPPAAFDNQWQPSADALDIMTRSGIDPEFIDSVCPEFILYWRERGGPPREVNSKFIAFVRSRWTRYSAGLVHSTEPVPMTRDWQPHEHVYDILALAGIEREYGRSKVPEFVLYWCDSNELHTSWNSKFLQHVKHQWRWEQRQGRSHGEEQSGGGSGATGRTRDRSIADDLSDTSWAN